jgi:DNA-binding NtrC family response regulator
VDVCFISATNEDVEKRAATGGGFRDDVLRRLRRGGTLVLPSLDERREDIPLLAKFFLEQMAGRTNCRAMSREAIEALKSWDWPGNVRELEDCLGEALRGPAHDVDELFPHHLRRPGSAESATAQTVQPDVSMVSPRASDTELGAILEAMSTYDFRRLSPPRLAARLRELAETGDRFIARYFEAVLESTRDHITGEMKPLRAFQTAAGTKDVKATAAWDNYVRFLQYLDLEPGSLLEEVFNHSVGQRKRRPKGNRW